MFDITGPCASGIAKVHPPLLHLHLVLFITCTQAPLVAKLFLPFYNIFPSTRIRAFLAFQSISLYQQTACAFLPNSQTQATTPLLTWRH